MDERNDWETENVAQSCKTSVFISQSSETSIQGLDLHSQSSILSTTTPFVLPIVHFVHPTWYVRFAQGSRL